MSSKLHRFGFVLMAVLLLVSVVRAQEKTANPSVKLLPNRVEGYQAAGPIETVALKAETEVKFHGATSSLRRRYSSPQGQRFVVTLVTTASDAGAYSLLTRARSTSSNSTAEGSNIGTSGFVGDGSLAFFKGRVFATVTNESKTADAKGLTDFATALADSLDKGEGEIPVLVKHLPDWENASKFANYVVTADALRNYFPEPVFEVVDFGGGAHAVAADYSGSRMVIIEFNTPQLATDNDQRITGKIQQLRVEGQSAPTAYRRVGNYSVFVFNAQNEQAGNQLIDQVKYQQVVQWLGPDPNIYERYERAQREFVNTTLGVFIAVVKGSGLAFVVCLAVGGLLGGLLFMRRRAQQRDAEAYSDAGGMLRLNIDEITPQTDPRRLVGPRN